MSGKKSTLELEKLLASYSIFYLNLRGYHWNLVGDTFFEFHPQFEGFYGQMEEVIDTVAERLRALGEFVVADYASYTGTSVVSLSKVKKSGITGVEALNETVSGFEALINLKKKMLPLFEEEKDYATIHMLQEQLQKEEKALWMLKAYLKK